MKTRTIKTLFPFLILLSIFAYNLSASIENSFPNGAVTLNSEQTITGTKEFTATPTINTHEAATKFYVDETAESLEGLLQQGGLKLYYVTATDSGTGGRLLATYPQAVATYIAYPALSATTYTQVNVPARISSVGVPGVATLTAGTINAVRYMSSDQSLSTLRSVTGVNELWLVDADGVGNPVFVATSSTYVVLGTEVQRVSTSYELLADVSTSGTTRRFLEKHYRKRTGTVTGANPIITVYYGGLYESLFTVQLPSAIVMKVDASNAEATAARMNLDVPSNEEARIYTDTLATASALALSNHAASNSTHGCTVIASEAAIAAHAALSTAHNATTLASEAYVTGYAAKLAGDAAQDFSAKMLTASGGVVVDGGVTGYGGAELQLRGDGGLLHAISTIDTGATTLFFDHRGTGNTGLWQWRNGSGGANTRLTLDASGNASFSGDVRANSFTLGGNLKTGSNWISGDGDNEGIYINADGSIRSGIDIYTVVRGQIELGKNDGDIVIKAGQDSTHAFVSGWIYNATPSLAYATLETWAGNGNISIQRSGGEVLIATTTDAGNYKLQVNGNAYVNGTIQGAHVASDTTAGISAVVYLATQTMTFKDGLLVSVTNP